MTILCLLLSLLFFFECGTKNPNTCVADKLYRRLATDIGLPFAIPIVVTRNSGATPLIRLMAFVCLQGISLRLVRKGCSVSQKESLSRLNELGYPRSRTDVNPIKLNPCHYFQRVPHRRVRLNDCISFDNFISSAFLGRQVASWKCCYDTR